jgi:hypothetical protein
VSYTRVALIAIGLGIAAGAAVGVVRELAMEAVQRELDR